MSTIKTNTRMHTKLNQNGRRNTIRLDQVASVAPGRTKPTDFFTIDDLQFALGVGDFDSITLAIESGTPINKGTANRAADLVRKWALSRGATHYCHWFHPLTGLPAEKQDAIQVKDVDGKTISSFDGGVLVRCEPDASSFPNGGLRQTEQARGYTIWDPTSPMFINNSGGTKTLCIPAVFISWTGESLGLKGPLLRSADAISKQAMRVLRFLGTEGDASSVRPSVGAEQEFFVVDRQLFESRSDLVNCGRTLLGRSAPRNQQLSDCYFGNMPSRIRKFLASVELELKRLGIPIMTRHNEVAPHQFEMAPVFEQINLACDHQVLTTQVLHRVAHEHGLECLLHEKPFADINGSGKHNNWSLCTDTNRNLFDSGNTELELLQFMVFVCGVISSVDRWQDLLRASVASIGNDHRLGGHEAPPAIVSIFLGQELSCLVSQLENNEPLQRMSASLISANTPEIPGAKRHSGDRNRTSPFAFTGNKFEFRAVGSKAAIAWPNTVINTIIADGIREMMDEVEQRTINAPQVNRLDTLRNLLGELVKRHKRILFEGNNYSSEWAAEAESRGLSNLTDTAQTLDKWVDSNSVELFKSHGVLSRRELDCRSRVFADQYQTNLEIEADTLLMILRQQVLPAAIGYEHQIAQTIRTIQSCGVDSNCRASSLVEMSEKIDDLTVAIESLEKARAGESAGDVMENAILAASRIKPAMLEARRIADELEANVSEEAWPLTTYAKLLKPIC